MLLSHANTERDTISVANRILQTLAVPIPVGETGANVSASIGIARYPQDGQDLEALLKAADAAMYRVKKDGKNDFVFVG